MHAASDLVARVVRTDIAVVAVGRRPAYARSVGTRVVCRARVAVATGGGVVGKDAARGRVTRVIGTDIVVVADNRRSRMTRSSAASVACRTRVSIATGGGVVGKDAPCGRVTRVIGAHIVVVADY